MLDSVKSSGQCGKTALAQLSEQFFAEFEFVVDVLLVDRQLRLHLDEVFVVVELLRRELSAQEVRDAVATPVDAVLQLLRVVQLLQQFVTLRRHRALQAAKQDTQCNFKNLIKLSHFRTLSF